ncbi:MAG: GTP 3',8-cyclase MoaA [Bacteroidales bacterium]
MLDRFDREINYLRISVTDRCNLRCRYCIPCEDFVMLSHDNILRFDEIVEVVRQGVGIGIDKIRLTGGEPLVRRDVVKLVGMIASVEGVKDLAMTSNGILLDKFAGPLAGMGLKRVNISLDTMDPLKFRELTSGGDINQVLRGIEAARTAGLEPVKLNCVIAGSSSEPDALAVKKFADENGMEVRFIHQMDLGEGEFSVVEGGTGGDCEHCNRLRLTADGKIKPCLFSDIAYEVRKMGAGEAIRAAIFQKPARGTACSLNHFYNIGG